MREYAGTMSWPSLCTGVGMLRALVVGVGLCWSLAFIVIALRYGLQLYADGAMFSYAVAAEDVWAFHWHNISGRLSVFLLCLWPAESFVGLSGNAGAGIAVYGLLFYVAPLAGLIGTFAADRSPRRIIFVYACASTALLCPLVFGFPTEMCLAHALFWPALAVGHFSKRSIAGTLLVFIMVLALAFSHEGALVMAFAIVATLTLRGWRDASFLRAAAVFAAVVAMSAAVKILLPPDDYYADVFVRAALHFFDPAIFRVSIVLLLFAVLAGYGILLLLLSRWAPDRAYLAAAAIVTVLLVIYWRWLDHSVHADSRYYLRTALVILTPVFGFLAALDAMDGQRDLPFPLSSLQRTLTALRRRGAQPLAAVFLLLTLVHVVETGKFLAAWDNYLTAVTDLATGDASDPLLGDPRFVSSERVDSGLNKLSWFSTTPYLSVIAADFKPNRLVIDPLGNYFWLSCETATANAEAPRAIPKQARDLIRVYACMHR
jgi:hypothetical protein